MTSGPTASSSRLKIGKYAIALTIGVCGLAAAVFSVASWKHGFEVRSYFADVQGLHAGAPVRLAGVEVGTVKTVRARPELKEHPAEVVLALRTPYILSVPADATVSLASSGVLGPTFVDIDVRNTSAAPIDQEGVLKSVPSNTQTAEQLLERITEILNSKACGGNLKEHPAGQKKANERKDAK